MRARLVTDPAAPDRRCRRSAATSASSSITLFELGREVTSVLDLDELLQKIPQLIARLTKFQAFAVYLLDPQRRGAVDRLLGRLSRTTSPGRCG